MRESSKSSAVRSKEFYDRYMTGRVIDIGCGNDLVVPDAEPFDLQHGDANNILDYKEPASYDCVYSSHVLEHMIDVERALGQWWQLVGPGGYMVLVVPDAELYEQGMWPSLFNPDHKATFALDQRPVLEPQPYCVKTLLGRLPGARIIEIALQDDGYDYSLQLDRVSRSARVLGRLCQKVRYRLALIRMTDSALDRAVVRVFHRLGAPIDQTLGHALAQIQAIVQRDL